MNNITESEAEKVFINVHVDLDKLFEQEIKKAKELEAELKKSKRFTNITFKSF